MRNGSCTTRPASVPSARNFTVLSSESKPITLMVSAFLFSAIAWPAPCAMMRLEANTPRRFGLAVIRSGMMLRPVVAPLVGDQFQAGIFGGELFLEALGARVERADAGDRGDEGDIAFRLAGF